MAERTLVVSEPMTLAEIEAKYPDHCIYIVDREDDPDTGEMIGGRVAFAGKSKQAMYDFAIAHRREWRRTATLYTLKPAEDEPLIITRFLA